MYLSIILTCSSATAQYKWVDRNGSIVYSDVPPLNEQNSTKPMLTPFVKTKAKVLPVAQQPNKPSQSEGLASSVVETKKSMLYDKEACNQLQGYLRILQEGGRIVKPQANGERTILDDKAREKEIKDMQQKIADSCKKP